MSVVAHFALWAWVPLSILCFAFLPPRRAAMALIVGGYLFLPFGGYDFPGIPDLDRTTAVGYGLIAGMLLFDTGRVLGFRPRAIDLPMVIWCIAPFFSCISNQVGGNILSSVYDGISLSLDQFLAWGIAYFAGRIYLTDFAALREMAIAIFIGGLLYAPLCLIEIRLSPQLHRWVYGFRVGDARSFVQTLRLGGFRPTVFLQHGLAVGMFMTAASLMGIWLWISKSLKQIGPVPMFVLVPGLLVVTVLCKSAAALFFLMVGTGCMVFTYWTHWRFPLAMLVAAAPTYAVARSLGWSGQQILDALGAIFSEDRIQSLATRMYNEDLFVAKASLRPFFGWSAWNRFQVFTTTGKQLTTPDGLWVLALGQYGLVGLLSITMIFVLPAWYALRRLPAKLWFHPLSGPTIALTTLTALYMLDNILNAMINPIFTVAIGGLLAVLPQVRLARRRPRRAGSPRPADAAGPVAAPPAAPDIAS